MEAEMFESWAIVELFGHKKFAGRVSNCAIGGADVYNHDIAKRCRKLEQCGLVKITKARCGPVNGAECQPYFGCIATGLGKQIAKRLLPMFKQ